MEHRTLEHLTRHDFTLALELLRRLEDEASDARAFPVACLHALSAYVPCEDVLFEAGDGNTTREMHPHALSLSVSPGDALRITLRRRASPFGERERERIALVAPHVAFLWRLVEAKRPRPGGMADRKSRLTCRESEVMRWLACGKTDADIAAILAISPRTVHKHLEHIYVKLGVETRTAAVMRIERTTNAMLVAS